MKTKILKKNKEQGNLLQFENLNNYDSLFHFSSTIKGGVSKGTYTSFNLGLYSGDKQEDVFENRVRLASLAMINPEHLIVPYQTHEDKIGIIDQDFLNLSNEEQEERLKGIDALITDQKGICIGITTADCVPILIFDAHKNVFAAIHAGWKGTVSKIAGKTANKMVGYFKCSPNHLQVGIAPSISQKHFEVGEEVVDTFRIAGFLIEDIGYRNPQTNKIHLDLQHANELILNEAGIPSDNIEIMRLCTYSNPDKFFSARRQTIHSGRMITGGVIR